ncbi:MAG: hypothetical protein ACI4I9_09810 [Porcipelethomonas sp.]
MRTDEIELAAAKNRPLPKYMTMPEMCLYLSLRSLYGSYRRGEIEADAAKNEKQQIIGKCKEFEITYDNWCKVYKARQDNIRKAGTMLNDIEKSDKAEDIAALACEVIGMMTGDASFADRQKRKIFKEEP